MARTLRADTVLQRAAAIHVELTSGEAVSLHRRGRQLNAGGYALALLDAFAHPRTFADGLAEVGRRTIGVHDWIDMSTDACLLVEAGFLEDARARMKPVGRDRGYGSAEIHIDMLDDDVRTRAFQAAIRQVVRPGDAVLDIGTGTGILAVTAANAGARHVYAIESSAIGYAARAVFAANGVADRVTLLHGRSTRLELPERADVLVSEMIGDPLDEEILEIYADAQRRLLEPDARVIPESLTLMVLPLTVPAEVRERYFFSARRSAAWGAQYGIDFTPLPRAEADGTRRMMIPPQRLREWPQLGPPAAIASYDLRTFAGRPMANEATLVLASDGRFDGLLLYFDAGLAPGIRLSVHPDTAGEHNHWHMPLWLLHPGFDGKAGTRYHVRLDNFTELTVTTLNPSSP